MTRNPSSYGSYRSSKNGRSSISSKRIQAEAEKAALEAHAAALHKKHVLEEQAEQLRRKKEQLEIDTEIASSTAKLAVLMSNDGQSAVTNGMESYIRKGAKPKEKSKPFNPDAKEFTSLTRDCKEKHRLVRQTE